MTAPSRKVVRKPRTKAEPEKPTFNPTLFRQGFQQFVTIKKQIEDETKRLDSLKVTLKEVAMTFGEKDESTGHFYLTVDEPVDNGEKKFDSVKIERRAPRTLNPERARALLEEKGLIGDVEKHVVTLVLDPEQAAEIAQYLADNGLVETVSEQHVAISEDDLLEAHYRDKENFTADEVDSLYDVNESFAFVPQKV